MIHHVNVQVQHFGEGQFFLQDVIPTSGLAKAKLYISSIAGLLVRVTSGFKNSKNSPIALSAPRLHPLEKP